MKHALILAMFIAAIGLGACQKTPKTALPGTASKNSPPEPHAAVKSDAPGKAGLTDASKLPAAAHGNEAATLKAAKPENATTPAVDDTVISTKVRAAIAGDKMLPASEINVETVKGVVLLSGTVNSQAIIIRTGEIAKIVEGVQSVRNDIRFR